MTGQKPRRVVTRDHLRGLKLSDRQIDRRLASGEFVAPRRGVIARADSPSRLVPVGVEAALVAHRTRDLVLSHGTAAEIHGFPEPLSGWGEPTFTSSSGTNRRRDGVVIRVAPLAPAEVVVVGGVPVTAPARTVVDCLRTFRPADALAIADAACRSGDVSAESLLAVVKAQSGWPGIVGARKLVALVSGDRESPLESWTAWAFARARVPEPVWQVDIDGPAGDFIGRVDCWWAAGVAGEADGKAKYALAPAGRSLLDVIHDERAREARLRKVGVEVVRWNAADVLDDHRALDLSRLIRGAVADALRRPRFRGRATPHSRPTP